MTNRIDLPIQYKHNFVEKKTSGRSPEGQSSGSMFDG